MPPSDPPGRAARTTNLDTVYRFRAHLRPVAAGQGLLFLLGELEHFLVKGLACERVAALVDGRRSAAEIVEALAGQVSPPEVVYLLGVLHERGYTTASSGGPSAPADAFFEALGVDATRAARALATASVAVVALGSEDPGALVRALEEASLAVRDDAALRVLLVGDYLDPRVEEAIFDPRFFEARWCPVKVTGPTCWVGPLFQRGTGACFRCLAHRLRANRPDRVFVERRLGPLAGAFVPRAETAASRSWGAHFAAMEVQRLALGRAAVAAGVPAVPAGGAPAEDQRLLTFDHRRLAVEEHPVVRRPQCPRCGDPELLRKRAAAPLRLAARRRLGDHDGGYRCASATETFDRLKPQISALTGIVPHVRPVPGRDHPLRPVHSSAYFVCPSHDDPSFADFARASLGKGRTPDQARAGALAEAIERHSAVFQGDEALVASTLADLGGDGLAPDALQNFSEAQLLDRVARNRRVKELRRSIPAPFDGSACLQWAPAWSLTHEKRRFLPAMYSYAHLPASLADDFCLFDPNGHAAGNCLEEAVLQGFLELAERDAVGVWWYGRVPRPEVSLESFAEPYFDALVRHYRAMGQRLWVLDLTNDLDLPAFAALARADDGDRWCIGFGCHLEPRLGVQRALTELNQLFDPEGRAKAPWDDAAMTDHAFLRPDEAASKRVAEDFETTRHDDLRDAVLDCVERARRVGLETVVLDQTRPDSGLSVVQVVVPGLRHIWPRLGPGRLYDVPVRMGWRKRARTETELNPVPLFL
jgi:bacteriocin biosynthesis cyclodehydratase domain-containing protein